jgi:hypothetical protein
MFDQTIGIGRELVFRSLDLQLTFGVGDRFVVEIPQHQSQFEW